VVYINTVEVLMVQVFYIYNVSVLNDSQIPIMKCYNIVLIYRVIESKKRVV
jgi:hypothetical protein